MGGIGGCHSRSVRGFGRSREVSEGLGKGWGELAYLGEDQNGKNNSVGAG